jgi:Xaa-Pro aminopeptidase
MMHPGTQPQVPLERYAERRSRVLERLGERVLVLPASPVRFKSGDTEYRYRPNSNLYYLSGFAEPDCVLVLRGGATSDRVVAFVRSRDPARELWEGLRMGVDEAGRWVGADACHPVEDLGRRLPELLAGSAEIVHRLGIDPRVDEIALNALASGPRQAARGSAGPLGLLDPSPFLDPLRLRKDPDEIALIERAAGVTVSGFEHALRRLRPSMGEWEVEADLEWRFRADGGFGAAFGTIVAAADRACILHYTDNHGRIGADDLVLIDAGAELGCYAGDVTRTVPASGRFAPAQRDVYQIVLEAQREAIRSVRPGATLNDVHEAASGRLIAGLVELGILSGTVDEIVERKAHRPFMPHKTSHWLGLDVHDVGAYEIDGAALALEPGMVLTVEPGLYLGGPGLVVPRDGEPVPEIPEPLREIGVRIEDDVVVTEDGHRVLTERLPKAPDDLGALLGSA